MNEVVYSINGKYFKDFGVYVSSSEGLIDALKRKPVKTYNWSEFNGESIDLSDVKFEARQITLSCFIKGENFPQMQSRFQSFINEFQKSGTQRLMVRPFGYNPLVYEVYISDEVKLNKTFNNGQMVGTFQIKIIEPNPVKKVLLFDDKTGLNLHYNCPSENEIFFNDGKKITVKGDASLTNRNIPFVNVGEYNYAGRNMLHDSKVLTFLPLSEGFGDPTIMYDDASGDYYCRNKPASDKPASVSATLFDVDEEHGFTFKVGVYVRHFSGVDATIRTYIHGDLGSSVLHTVPSGEWVFVSTNPTTAKEGQSVRLIVVNFWGLNGVAIDTKKIIATKGTVLTGWQAHPSEERYIIIAGDVDKITNLNTNAKLIWQKL